MKHVRWVILEDKYHISISFQIEWDMIDDRGDSFPLDFERNGIPFGSENRKENCSNDPHSMWKEMEA